MILNAVKKAFVSRGKNKGKLLKNAPKSNTLEFAAWNALQSNPWKIKTSSLFFMDKDQLFIYNEISKLNIQAIDQDREILESIGAW